ncbi:transient receptor potential cation channel subfamily A member 1-like [Lasioglossum baleicum]|uniref:transient receptor potential cation channel subfamily A member 1-like n=1 Tax=Lasioglossum baleicum TaxID=434251 RepID=UPI003FCCB0D3
MCEKRFETLLQHNLIVNREDVDNPGLLNTAVEKGYLNIVEDLLKYGADINRLNRSRFGRDLTALHSAVKTYQVEVAQLLLNYGANVNVKDGRGTTPIDYAIQNGDTEMTKLLLANGADIKDNPNLLSIAAGNGSLKIVEDLLKYGADVNRLNSSTFGRDLTALHSAVKQHKVAVAQLLINYGANVNFKNNLGDTPIVYAIENSDTEMAKLLLTNGADIKDNPNLLCTAAGNGSLQMVEDLLKHGADVNMLNSSICGKDLTPLHSAVKKYQVEVAQLLIDYGANVNFKDDHGDTPIVCAIENGDTEMTKLLLTNGADIKDNPNLLCTAAGNGSLKIVEDQLKYGADVNILNSSRFGRDLTPLHSAVKGKQMEMAKLLIKYGANVNVKDGKGRTPIVYAIENRDTEMTKLLLTNGADIKEDPSLLCTAAGNGSLKIVQDLLKYGADVNMLNSSRFGSDLTPLHSAVKTYQVEVAKLLINHGANVNVKDSEGRTSIFYAIQYRDTKFTKLLLTNGADIKEDPSLLCTAVENGSLKIVEDLLTYGADVNMSDSSRSGESLTPLHSAVKKYQVEVAKLLINYGANVNVKDSQGKTPIVYAIEKRDTIMTELLLINGADVKDDSTVLFMNSATIKLLKQHIAKVRAAGLHVSERNLLWITNDREINNFLIECEEEIEIMKREKIDNSYVSFYDILTKNISQLAKNESIVQAFKSDDYKIKYPIYASMIDSRFGRGVEREELLEQVRNKFLRSCFESLPDLPVLCTEKVFSYLSKRDLRILLVACEP